MLAIFCRPVAAQLSFFDRAEGQIVRCGLGVEGYRVSAYLKISIGRLETLTAKAAGADNDREDATKTQKIVGDFPIPDPGPIVVPMCLPRDEFYLIGSTLTDAEGHYNVALGPPLAPENACSIESSDHFILKVYEVGTGNLVHTSPELTKAKLVEYDWTDECLEPAGNLVAVTFDDSRMVGDGSTMAGVVELRQTVPQGKVVPVRLYTSEPAVLDVPGFVLVSGGQKRATFEIRSHAAKGTRAIVFATSGDQVRTSVVRVDAALDRLGDSNGDGSRDIADAINILNYLFVGGATAIPFLLGLQPRRWPRHR